MNLDPSNAISWLFGCFIGFMLGYIIRYLQDIKSNIERDQNVNKFRGEEGVMGLPSPRQVFMRIRKPRIHEIAIFLALCFTAFAAFSTQSINNDLKENYRQDQIRRCEAGVDTRIVDRGLADGVYGLATSFAQIDPNAPEMTPEEVAVYNQFIKSVNQFRKDMYAKIKPADICKPFVDDDNVKPKDPYPLIPVPKE